MRTKAHSGIIHSFSFRKIGATISRDRRRRHHGLCSTPISKCSRCMPKRQRVSPGSTSFPIDLSGFSPLVSFVDPSFPLGRLVDSHYRSRRAKLWWRRAIDAIRMMIRNLDPTRWFWTNREGHWKRTAPRPPPVNADLPNDDFIWRSDFMTRVPGSWSRSSGLYSDAQDVLGFHPHPYLDPMEDDRGFNVITGLRQSRNNWLGYR